MTNQNQQSANCNHEEVYRQRYETFRHLDKLRWQMLQIGVASSSIVFAVSDNASLSSIFWLTWFVIGLILLLSGAAMLRIGKGISANAIHLASAASEIGDFGIPDPDDNLLSVGNWIAWVLVIGGIGAISMALFSAAWGG